MTSARRRYVRRPLRYAALVSLSLAALLSMASGAAAQEEAGCFPPCRAGFVCHQGRCVSACNPPCADNELCSPAGECVSRCNPGCGPTETCNPAGDCVPSGSAQPPGQQGGQQQGWVSTGPRGGPPPGQQPPGMQQQPPGMQQQGPGMGFQLQGGGGADPGWARGAAVAGYVSAGAVAILTGVSIGLNEEDDDGGRIVGGIATVGFGAMGIVTAMGGASARNHPQVRGAPVLRVLCWIGYGLTLLDAAFLIGISFEEDVSSAHIASVGALGVVTLIGFAVDASISAGEAESVGGGYGDLNLRPVLSLRPDETGSLAGFFGLTGDL